MTAPPVAELSLEEVVPYLRASSLLSGGDIVRGVEVADRSRRNRNFRVVTHQGPRFLVKQPLTFDDGTRGTVTREAFVLRALQEEPLLAPLRWCTPRLVGFDEDNTILTTELVAPATSLTKFHLNLGDVRFPPETAHAAAAILAKLHASGGRAVRDGALTQLRREEPYGWSIRDRHERHGRDSTSMHAFASALEGLDAWSRLPALRAMWAEAEDIVHGDVRWDNWLVCAGRPPVGPCNLRLIDWEFARIGDGAWDAACFLAEYIRFWLTTSQLKGAGTRAEAEQYAPFRPEQTHASARSFMRTYARRRGWRKADLAAHEARVHAYLPFCLVVIAAEHLTPQVARPGGAIPLATRLAVELAAEAEREPGRFAATWFGWPEGSP